MSTVQPRDGAQPARSRRSFLYFLPTIPLVAAAASWLTPLTRRDGRPSAEAGNRTTAGQASLHESSARGRQLMNSYPQPQWLPEDFQVRTALAGSPEAVSRARRGIFMEIDDSAQLRIAAQRRSTGLHAHDLNSSLLIHVAPAEQLPSLRGEESLKSQPVLLRTVQGEVMSGRYYEDPRGNEAFGATHAMAFHRDGFAICVASFYKNGLTRTQLERVAVSVSRG